MKYTYSVNTMGEWVDPEVLAAAERVADEEPIPEAGHWEQARREADPGDTERMARSLAAEERLFQVIDDLDDLDDYNGGLPMISVHRLD